MEKFINNLYSNSNFPIILISLIAIFIVSNEIMVGITDKAIAQSQRSGLSMICSSVQNLRLKT